VEKIIVARMFRMKNTETSTEAKKGISAEHGKQEHIFLSRFMCDYRRGMDK
jgi:hypothetical protein